jgi:hypothetical protein
MSRPNNLWCYVTLGLGRLVCDKNFSLLDPFVSYKENEVL